MNTFFNNRSYLALLVGSVMLIQGCAQTTLASRSRNPDISVAYNAIVKSSNQQETIAKLVANGQNPDTVASIATVAGVPLATINAALPGIAHDQLVADVTAAQNDPVAYSAAAEAGIVQSGNSQFKGPRSLRQSF